MCLISNYLYALYQTKTNRLVSNFEHECAIINSIKHQTSCRQMSAQQSTETEKFYFNCISYCFRFLLAAPNGVVPSFQPACYIIRGDRGFLLRLIHVELSTLCIQKRVRIAHYHSWPAFLHIIKGIPEVRHD
ncbi:hypothetical protein BpHYR1_015828 [Brachionus plicatilis]|uniref:Uncharacterized protein n=1 Tax=Brachionus plicatilis TaxID=10195 RepID=A0A3M7SNK9_BRAPC|nr:hypothetical protein BpHYR1_015828 [Brachionus plicatilis]